MVEGQFTLFFNLFLRDFLLVLFQVVGIHLLEWVSRCIVGLVNSCVVLLVASNDSCGDGTKNDGGVLSTEAGQVLLG